MLVATALEVSPTVKDRARNSWKCQTWIEQNYFFGRPHALGSVIHKPQKFLDVTDITDSGSHF
jgi:hypothetical protein